MAQVELSQLTTRFIMIVLSPDKFSMDGHNASSIERRKRGKAWLVERSRARAVGGVASEGQA